jgi:hypothetical protein
MNFLTPLDRDVEIVIRPNLGLRKTALNGLRVAYQFEAGVFGSAFPKMKARHG